MSAAASKVRYSLQANVAVLEMDNPPVNSLGFALRSSLKQAFTQAQRDPAVQAIVLIGANNVFCAGADITEFPAMKKMIQKGVVDPNGVPLPQLINEIEGNLMLKTNGFT